MESSGQMNAALNNTESTQVNQIEKHFPTGGLSKIAISESWRKEVNRPIYHIHKWWATRLGTVFRALALGALLPECTDILTAFYEKYQLKNKIILDPFMGSGTTLGETAKLGAKAIGCDINPVSSFMVRQAFTSVDLDKLKLAFRNLEERCAQKIQHFYKTQDPDTGELIPVLYYFWVKTVTTPEGELIPLFSKYVFSQDAYPKRKPKAQIVCPQCWSIIEGRYDDTEIKCQKCGIVFNPQDGPVVGSYVKTKTGKYKIKDLIHKDKPISHQMYAMMALRNDGEKVYLPISNFDISLYNEASQCLSSCDLPLPSLLVRPGHNTDQARGYNYIKWKDFFNDRQLFCLGTLLKSILEEKDIKLQEQLICLFSSTLEFNNMFCSFKGEGTGAVRHMFYNHILKPERTPLENSIWGTSKSSGTFSTLFESRLLKAKNYLTNPFELLLHHDVANGKVSSDKIIASNPIDVSVTNEWGYFSSNDNAMMVLNGDSSCLPIPDSCVDAVITDPPYFDFIHYSELSDFFFAWLAPILKDRYSFFSKENSYNIGEVQHKDPLYFSRQLSNVFKESYRTLKDNGLLIFSFHHSRPDGWAAIHEAISSSGFKVVAAYPIHAELKSSSIKSSTKEPISIDSILVCKKTASLDNPRDRIDFLRDIQRVRNELLNNGISLSKGDDFVIHASQFLIDASNQNLSYEDAKKCLESIKLDIASLCSSLETRTDAL